MKPLCPLYWGTAVFYQKRIRPLFQPNFRGSKKKKSAEKNACYCACKRLLLQLNKKMCEEK